MIGLRRFSTRPFRNKSGSSSGSIRSSSRGEFRASKSLIEDEAELSDWVGDLKKDSARGRISSDDEGLDKDKGFRGPRSREWERNKGQDSVKRRREGGREEFSESRRRENDSFSGNSRFGSGRGRGRGRGGVGESSRRKDDSFSGNSRFGSARGAVGEASRRKGDSFSGNPRFNKRFDSEEEEDEVTDDESESESESEVYSPKKGIRAKVERGNGNSLRGKRNDRSVRGSDSRNVRTIMRKQPNFSEGEDVGSFEERRKLVGDIGELLSEDNSDVDEDDASDNDDDLVIRKSVFSDLGLEDKSVKVIKRSSSGTSDSYLSETRFDQCTVFPLSLKAIKDAGYEKMTVVQEATLPVILKGKDVLAKAKTGSGKTVAFLLPSIEVVVKTSSVDRDVKRPPILVLVICPTRELATQAATEANTLLKYHPTLGVQVVIGGTRLALEQKRMQVNPCQILVATPGRLRDHIENTAGFATRLMGVKVLVLDEADHLLDMGFRKDIERIVAAVPKQRQTLMFSATIPEEVRQVCHLALKRDHEFINTVEEGSEETNTQVRQTHMVAPLDKHFPLLYALLKDHIADNVDFKVLVFCTTAMVTRLVANLLAELKLNVREIHSRKPQSYRTKVSEEFRKSKGLILVTSDVSARGVDYPDVTLVVQVGLPSDREQYIHRLGRTGRKGKEGEGILMLAPWEEYFLSTIKDLPITKATMPSVDPDTNKKVERALCHVEMKNKEAAYQAWLGYYNSMKGVSRDKVRLVELANEFSRTMGLDNPPAIPKLVLGKMGLKNVPGLRSK